jgi:hypothetical protein
VGGAAASKRHVHFSGNVENEVPAGAGHGLRAAPSTPAAHRRRTQPDSGRGSDKQGVRARVACARTGTADDPARASRMHMVVTYARVPLGLCWWCWCRRGPSSAPRCRGLPWGRAASDQDCGQPRAEGGPIPKHNASEEAARGWANHLDCLPHTRCARARTHPTHNA